MPTYAPAPRQYKKRLTIPAGAEVLCFAPGIQPDEGVRVPAAEFGGGGIPGVSTGDGPFAILVPGINLKAVAVTDLFTVPTGKRFILLDVILRITAATAISNGLVSQVTENGGSTNISSASTAINTAAVNTVGEIYFYPRFPAASASLNSVAAGAKVQFNITTGMTATTAVGEVAIVGFLVDA